MAIIMKNIHNCIKQSQKNRYICNVIGLYLIAIIQNITVE